MGALIAICGYMVFRMAGGIPTTQDIADVKMSLSAHVSSTAVEMTQIRSLLRAICFNTATTENQRAACNATP